MKRPLYLQSGTIGACKATTGIAIGNALMSPKTDRGHYFLVWDYLPIEDDYLILESINKGIAITRMSKYRGKGVKFFEVDCPIDLRQDTPIALTKWGESNYDWLLIIKLAVGGLKMFLKNLIKEGKIRRLVAEELPYGKDSALICTEAIQTAYLAVGVPIINPEIVPTPSAFKQAEFDGMLIELDYKW